jgi:hypothetical protein
LETDLGRDAIRKIETQLASHPAFGDSQRILQRANVRYEFALEVLSSRLPGIAADARVIVDHAPHALRDPVLITACENALLRLERGELSMPDEFETIVSMIASRLRRSHDLLPTQTEDNPRFRMDSCPATWLLSMTRSPGALLQRLHAAMTDQFIRYNEVSGEFCSADTAAAESLSRAVELLQILLPQLSVGVINHITAIGLLTGTTPTGRHLSAAGGDVVPGTMVISPHVLGSPWDASGILLHEGLHLKAFDIMRSFALVSEPHEEIEIPWRHVRWDMRRVFVSFHVYAHLVLFQAAATHYANELADRFGPLPDNVAISRGGASEYAGSIERMMFLGEQLTGPMRRNLTPDGIRLATWLLHSTEPFTGRQEPRRSVSGTTSVTQSDPPVATRIPEARYMRAPGIIIKPVPDLEMAYVYNPDTRRVSCLNLHAWVILELCDGSADIADSYTELVGSRVRPKNAAFELAAGLSQLMTQGLVKPVKGGDPA